MKTKSYNLHLIKIMLFFSLLKLNLNAQNQVVVYAQNNTPALTAAQYQKMTHFVYAFFNPMSTSGDVTNASGVPNPAEGSSVWFNTSTFTSRIAAARAANPNIKIIISTGGAPTSSDPNITTRLNTILNNAAARTAFADDLAAFVANYDLDGWDFDLEHPTTPTEKNNHQTFLSMMRTRFNALEATECRKLEISIALNGETDHFVVNPTGSDYVNPGVNPFVDYYNLMTYDASYTTHNSVNPAWPLNHSPLIHCQEAVRDFSSPPFNWPKSKMRIGIPFYGKTGHNGSGGTSPYSALNSSNSVTIYNSTTDVQGVYNFNACPTITNKINFAKSEKLAGVVVWEGTQDLTTGSYTLLGCIQNAMGTYPTYEQTCCEKPNLGSDLLTCNTPFPITLNSNTNPTGATYVWTRIAPTTATINASGTNTQVITAAHGPGTYVVARTQGSCTRRDTIVITNATSLPVPNLGPDRTLCALSYDLFPLNLSSFPPGTTWQWQLNSVNIPGATNDTLYASSSGTYRIIASLGGCTSTQDDIVITTSSVSAVDACRTTAGTLTLGVSGGVGPFNWYDADVPGGNLVGTGTTYTTPVLPLPSTTYYYVEDLGTVNNYIIGIDHMGAVPTGFANNTTDPPTFSTGGTNISMEFDVTAPIRIRSVDVYPWGAATYPTTFNIVIYNANLSVVYTSPNITWNVWPGGWQTITLNANLVKGKYRMQVVRVSGGVPAFFHQASSSFPYTGGAGKISITRQIFVGQYGPFYKWQISDFGNCQRIRVRATVATSCDGALAADLLNFYGENTGYKTNRLFWTTASEANNDYFILSRSKDGVEFIPIAYIDGAGNSSIPKNYQYNDYEAYAGTTYYKLTQVDFDGNMSDSEVINISNSAFNPQLIPNPFSDVSYLTIHSSQSDVDLSVTVYDMEGKILQQKNHLAPHTPVPLGEGLPRGIYFVQIISNSANETLKLIKQ